MVCVFMFQILYAVDMGQKQRNAYILVHVQRTW